MSFIRDFFTSASIALQPYKSIVGQSAALLSIVQMLSPLFMFNDMRKAKSTLGMPFMPFLLIAVLTSLSVRFSQLLKDDASFNANLIGFSLSLVYMSIYYFFVPPQEKLKHLMKIFAAGTFIGLVILYSQIEDPEKIETRFGFILTSVMYCLFSMPVLDIYKTFKRKNTKHMPFPMISSGTLVGFAWLLHGIIINSGFIIAQNLVMVGINLFQLSLFLIYPSGPASKEEKANLTKTQKKKTK